jgi:hypothetical protein
LIADSGIQIFDFCRRSFRVDAVERFQREQVSGGFGDLKLKAPWGDFALKKERDCRGETGVAAFGSHTQ